MNERLRELVRQAGLDDADFPIENWDNIPLSKFAELIVRECMKVSNLSLSKHELPSDKIAEHFGVKL
jgi:hypothetical protein